MSSAIYRQKGIYGIYGASLTDRDAYLLGKALGSLLHGARIMVGGDVRLSTPALKGELLKGLLTSGCHTFDAGILPLPALAFAGSSCGAAAIVMVTGSPLAAGYNGFKVFLEDGPLSADKIPLLKKAAVTRRDFLYRGGRLESVTPMWDYLKSLEASAGRVAGSRILLDCGYGACSVVAPRLFRDLGCDVTALRATVDGTFPDRSPAITSGNIRELGRAVIRNGAQMGIIFDDDGDELAVVDSRGRLLSYPACKETGTLVQTAYGCCDAIAAARTILESLNDAWSPEEGNGG